MKWLGRVEPLANSRPGHLSDGPSVQLGQGWIRQFAGLVERWGQ
jgi:hypothetical protein